MVVAALGPRVDTDHPGATGFGRSHTGHRAANGTFRVQSGHQDCLQSRALVGQRRPLSSRLAACEPLPRGSTRPGMKPNWVLEASAILREKRPRRGRSLHAKIKQYARPLSIFINLLKPGWPGLRSISIGREDPSALASVRFM